jgi:D-aminoacyl-tRNA deacylase
LKLAIFSHSKSVIFEHLGCCSLWLWLKCCLMKVVIQRVMEASVTIDSRLYSQINNGILVLLGVEHADAAEDIDWLVKKIVNLRIFNDGNGVMNLSLLDVGGEVMVVSQFTLHARTKKGNRPSYVDAAPPLVSIPLYEQFVAVMQGEVGRDVATGLFGADMKVSLVNDGPVTIVIDTKNKS